MKKTINKIMGLFSLGLLLFAVEIPYAHATRGIEHQDAWEFMDKNVKEHSAQFKADFGNENNLKADEVICGKRICNIKKNVCLEKKSSTTGLDYICVKKKLEEYI